MPSTTAKPFLIGLSGPSSSGKTTLARLLRSIFNVPASETSPGPSLSLFILHQDDFYKTDADIPLITATSSTHGTRTLQDWDCAESLDLPLLASTLRHVKATGSLPPEMFSKEDQNSVGESGVTNDEVELLAKKVRDWFSVLSASLSSASTKHGMSEGSNGKDQKVRICLIDGFLLFPSPPSSSSSSTSTSASPTTALYTLLQPLLDQRLFLLASRQQTLTRRANRTGYVTLEGFWADPPGYVEDVVWPNYARDHAWMFQDGDVDGMEVQEDRIRTYVSVDGDDQARKAGVKSGILVAPGKGQLSMSKLLEWAVDALQSGLEASLKNG